MGVAPGKTADARNVGVVLQVDPKPLSLLQLVPVTRIEHWRNEQGALI